MTHAEVFDVARAMARTRRSPAAPVRVPTDEEYQALQPTKAEADALLVQVAPDAVLLVANRTKLYGCNPGGSAELRRMLAGMAALAAQKGVVRDAYWRSRIVQAAEMDPELIPDASDAVSLAGLTADEFEHFLVTGTRWPTARVGALTMLGYFRPDLLAVFRSRARHLGQIDPIPTLPQEG